MDTPRFLDRRTAPHIATLILMAGISALSMSIFLPSLSNMADHFGVPYGVMQLAVPFYLVTLAIVQIVAGPIADRFGRRPVALVSLVIFGLASIGCALAPNVSVFLAFRVIQAVVATLMLLSRAVVRDLYDSEKAASMLSYVIMGMSIVPMIGPSIGGYLDEAFGWQGSFYLLSLAAAACFAIIWFDLLETRPERSANAPSMLAALPELLRSQRFWAYVLTAAFSAGSYFALLGGASKIGEDVFGLTPSQTGIAMGIPAIGYLIGNGISGRFAVRIGLDRLIMWGAVLTSVAMGLSWAMGVMGWHSKELFFGFCTFLGLGNGLVMPNAMAGMLSVRPKLAGTASGIGGAAQIAGGALMATLSGFLLQHSLTAVPLQAIMALSAFASTVTAFWAFRRTAQLAAQD